MKHLRYILFMIVSVCSGLRLNAQCANDNTLTAGNLTPPGVSLSTAQAYNAGQYMLAQTQAGANYTVSTCGGSGFDTQITVYDDVTGTLLAYNDDFCGLQSTVSFTPTTCNPVRVLLDQYFCNNSGLTTTVTMTQNTAGTGNPTVAAGNDAAVCTGVPVTIGNASPGSGGQGPYSYAWNPPSGLSNATQPDPVATVGSTTTYTLTITDANGCQDTDAVTVVVNPSPTVALGPDVTQCGGTVVLDAGNPGASYLWSTGAGTQTLPVTTTGTYAVTVMNSFGCNGGDNINVTINPLPVFSLGADTSQCGGTVVLNGPSGYTGYAWSTGSTTQTDSVTATTNVGLTVTDANGCSATDSQMVTINSAPTVNIGPDVTQCGGSVALDAGNPGSIYFWSNGPTGQMNNVTSSATYYVDVFSPQGCHGADTAVIVINPLPVVDLGPDTAVCTSSFVLDAGNPGNTYSWNVGPPMQTNTVSSSGQYSVVVTTAQGCSDADTVIVTLNSSPNVDVTANNTTICSGNSAILTATGGSTYLWSTGGSGSSITVNPTLTTTYYVIGTDANGCQGSDVVTINVIPNPTASFTYNMVGVTAVFTNTSTGASSYTWDFGDSSPTSSQQNPSHTYTVNGSYTVTLTVTGPCGTQVTTQVVTITNVGLQDLDLEQTLSLYPNPNSGTFTLSFNLGEAQDVVVTLFGLRGETISNENLEGISSYNRQFTIGDASAGVYFVRIQTQHGVATKRIVVQ